MTLNFLEIVGKLLKDELDDGVEALASIFGLEDANLITERVQVYKINQVSLLLSLKSVYEK